MLSANLSDIYHAMELPHLGRDREPDHICSLILRYKKSALIHPILCKSQSNHHIKITPTPTMTNLNRYLWQDEAGVPGVIRKSPIPSQIADEQIVVKVHVWAMNPADAVVQDIPLPFIKYPPDPQRGHRRHRRERGISSCRQIPTRRSRSGSSSRCSRSKTRTRRLPELRDPRLQHGVQDPG